MKRRKFIAGLGGAMALPAVAGAQQTDRMRRIAMLASVTSSDVQAKANYEAFSEALTQAGWKEGRSISTNVRYGGGENERIRADAVDIIAKSPEVILCNGTQVTGILKQQTSTIPIVFVNVADPVASGFVASFAHPAGNMTGFTSLQFSIAGKWLSLLKNIAPNLDNVMLLYSPSNSNWEGYLRTLKGAAPTLGISVRAAPAVDIGTIEQHIEGFAHQPGTGMIVVPSAQMSINRERIAALAERRNMPVIYPYRFFATSGGLASYGSDDNDLYQRAAQYVDLILRGAKPADLPVQAPTKFEFVINLKAAKAIGLTVSPSIQLLADEVIE